MLSFTSISLLTGGFRLLIFRLLFCGWLVGSCSRLAVDAQWTLVAQWTLGRGRRPMTNAVDRSRSGRQASGFSAVVPVDSLMRPGGWRWVVFIDHVC